MKYDEFTFFNQQLAAMLREGIPLEGALKQLAAGMKDGALKHELEELGQDLAKGVPLREAVGKRELPELYVRMVQLGAASRDLPGVLTLVADHYHRSGVLWTRMKGLLVYPFLVLLLSLAFSLVAALVISNFLAAMDFSRVSGGRLPVALSAVWISPILLTVVAAAALAAISLPRTRAWLRWRVPLLRDASLAQLASVISLLLQRGATLTDSLALAERLESSGPAAPALARWRKLAEQGIGSPVDWRMENKPFPPLFSWLIRQGGEDPASGFDHAARLYSARAAYKTELALYGLLPVSVLLLAQMLLWQVSPLFQTMVWFMNTLGDMGNIL